jgi:hypothetical protein
MDRNSIAQRARLLFNYHAMTTQYLDAYRHVTEIFDGRQGRDEEISHLPA